MVTSIQLPALVSPATLQASQTLRSTATRSKSGIVAAASNDALGKPSASTPSLSDVLWPSAGAFAAMAVLGKIDQMLEPKGLQILIAPFGAVCATLLAAPSSPSAQDYNLFLSHICCSLSAVVAWNVVGGGWLGKGCGLAASIAIMIVTRCVHPPAASLPLLFVDVTKFHRLNFWYALFPGLAGCLVIWLIKHVVLFLKENARF